MHSNRVTELLKKMSVKQKFAEMTQLYPFFMGLGSGENITAPELALSTDAAARAVIGSTLNLFGAGQVKSLQDEHQRATPHGIPLLFAADIIHGYKTVFPINLAMACSFDLPMIMQHAEIAAAEAASEGVMLTFSPMSDLVRDARWGRVMESSGEDPYLNAEITRVMVDGYQGDYKHTGKFAKGKLAACIKHFAAYGAGEGGREYNTVDMSDGIFYEYYLPAYRAAVDAGVAMAMTAFNTVNRLPATVNEPLLRGILRGEMGFDGVIISDANALDECIAHGVCLDKADAAKKALQAGLDIEMASENFLRFGERAVEEDPRLIVCVDEAVGRILALKEALGLFDNPYKDADEAEAEKLCMCDKHRAAARRLSGESAVLLKNDGVLPLKKGELKIGLCGPFAKSSDVVGGWAWFKEGAVSLFDGIAAACPKAEIVCAMTDPLGTMFDNVFDVADECAAAAQRLLGCDVIIAALGENQNDTAECASKTDIKLSKNQRKLVDELAKTGKPLVTVLFSGRPLEITRQAAKANAVLQAWFLGTESGNALADILFGSANPSGKLAMSFPRAVGQLPLYYNHFNTGRPIETRQQNERYVSRYLDCANEPLYPFGYGLSYSRFVYSDLKAAPFNGGIKAEVTVKNDSGTDGDEIVQLYIRDVVAGLTRPVKELKGFRRVHIRAGESVTVEFILQRDALSYYGNDKRPVFEAGEFDVMAGTNSEQYLCARIYVE